MDFNLNVQENYIYNILKTFMNNETKQCYPSVPKLAEVTKWSKNTVKKWLHSLEKKGYIVIQERKIIKDDKLWNDTHLYTLIKEKFVRMGQKNMNVGSNADTELNKKDMNDLEEEKNKLISTYGKDIFNKALKRLSNQIKKGNIINNTFAYLQKICTSIQQELQLIASISSADNVVDRSVQGVHKSPQSQQKKKSTAANSRFSKNVYGNLKLP